MASLGAKVLQTRSVELAMAKQVPVRVLSSFIEPDENGNLPENAGTLIWMRMRSWKSASFPA